MATTRKPRSKAPANPPVYTYRAGEKVTLHKRTDRFVVRALGPALAPLAARSAEQVSSASTRVRVRPRVRPPELVEDDSGTQGGTNAPRLRSG